MMRELTVKVSDNQFDTLVNYLRTLSYVQLPSVLKKNGTDEPIVDDEQPFDIASLGEMDNTPFDIEYTKKHHHIQWEHFQEVIDMFKDIPLENHIEQHTEIHA